MTGFDISTALDYEFNDDQVYEIYYGSTKIWPKHDYALDYLTFQPLENSVSFKWTDTNNDNSIYYSLDNGSTWTQLTSGSWTPAINTNNKILFKATSRQTVGGLGTFSADGHFNAMGNIMSLVYGDNFINNNLLPNIEHFRGLFRNCIDIVNAFNLILPATTLTNYCYEEMFNGCTSLNKAPKLPATTLANDCYEYMFGGCTSLNKAPKLPATTLANGCYFAMFISCSSLNKAPELPATALARHCYCEMFDNCTSLITAPELPATALVPHCYDTMFGYCTSLITAPELPATTLTDYCYFQMFKGCTSLTTAPALPATTLSSECYKNMFMGCTSLNYIKCLATDISTEDCTLKWVNNVSSTGTFVKNALMNSWTRGINGIPSGWVVQDALYENEYFTIEVINNNTQISFLARGSISSNLTDKLKYSLDDGTTWNSFTTIIDVSGHPATDLMTLNSGDRIMLKAQNLGVYTEGSGNSNGTFTILTSNAGYYNVSGNIMSLAYGDNFRDKKSLAGLPSYYFANLFNPINYQHNLVDASNLILPATTLSEYCYYRMFNLCHQLNTAPELPATTLADYCYYCMFSGCTSLTTAPMLPTATLADYCYLGMFSGCTNLSHITCLATDISALLCTDSWTDGVSQTGTFVKSQNMSGWTTGINGIPQGWTVQNAS